MHDAREVAQVEDVVALGGRGQLLLHGGRVHAQRGVDDLGAERVQLLGEARVLQVPASGLGLGLRLGLRELGLPNLRLRLGLGFGLGLGNANDMGCVSAGHCMCLEASLGHNPNLSLRVGVRVG